MVKEIRERPWTKQFMEHFNLDTALARNLDMQQLAAGGMHGGFFKFAGS